MAHKIEISDKTYELLKEYCNLNKLKIGQFTDKLIRDGLMVEMYGDVPFTNYRTTPQHVIEAKDVPNENETFEQNEAKTVWPEITKEMKLEALEEPIYLNPPPIDDTDKFCNKLTEDTLKEIGVPDKIVNKITRRRLK